MGDDEAYWGKGVMADVDYDGVGDDNDEADDKGDDEESRGRKMTRSTSKSANSYTIHFLATLLTDSRIRSRPRNTTQRHRYEQKADHSQLLPHFEVNSD